MSFVFYASYVGSLPFPFIGILDKKGREIEWNAWYKIERLLEFTLSFKLWLYALKKGIDQSSVRQSIGQTDHNNHFVCLSESHTTQINSHR